MLGFVKFFGQGTNRSPRERTVLDAVKTSGSHRICTYPRGRRPRAVREGDVMFTGHLVSGPDDIRVYGRAVLGALGSGRQLDERGAGAGLYELRQGAGRGGAGLG
jgi:hypothetical protein